MRRWTIVLSVVALMLGLIAPAGGAEAPGGSDVGINVEESPTGSYIVVMAADPLIASFEQPDLDSRPAKNAERGLKNGHKKALEDAGLDADSIVNEYTVALNGFSAVLDYEEAKAIARQDGVSMVLPDEMYHPTTENSPTFLGLDDPAGAWARGFDGEDVIIGVIDTGIWPEHRVSPMMAHTRISALSLTARNAHPVISATQLTMRTTSSSSATTSSSVLAR